MDLRKENAELRGAWPGITKNQNPTGISKTLEPTIGVSLDDHESDEASAKHAQRMEEV